jgi:cytochrome c nitrite reductase small subunit
MAGNFLSKRFLFRYSLIPPKKWRPAATVLVAVFLGIGFYTLKLSNAVSYLSDDPKACVNCHLMTPQYITWNHSSHREVAHCNDCHVPQDNLFSKFYFKAKDGLYHSTIFTLRAEPQVIQALQPSMEVIQNNCVRCHQDRVVDHKLTASVESHEAHRTERACWECHREVPHGRVKSLSSVGIQPERIEIHAREKAAIIPPWLKEMMEKKQTTPENTSAKP